MMTNLIMSRLPNLKTADDQYRKISVKDDFTPDERSQIRLWHEKATNLNAHENTTQYKVRGSPENGLYLVKIKAPQVKPVDSSPQVVAYQMYPTAYLYVFVTICSKNGS